MQVDHHPAAADALAEAGFSLEMVGRCLTALTKAGLEVGEPGAQLAAWSARQQRDYAARVLRDVVRQDHGSVRVAVALLGQRWAVEAVECSEGGMLDVWVEQARRAA